MVNCDKGTAKLSDDRIIYHLRSLLNGYSVSSSSGYVCVCVVCICVCEGACVCKTWLTWTITYFHVVKNLDFCDCFSEYYISEDGLLTIIRGLVNLRHIRLDGIWQFNHQGYIVRSSSPSSNILLICHELF